MACNYSLHWCLPWACEQTWSFKRSSYPSTLGALVGNSETSNSLWWFHFANFRGVEPRQRSHFLWVFPSNNQHPPLYDGGVLLEKRKINPLKLEKGSSLAFTFQDFLQTMQWPLAGAKWGLAVSEWFSTVLPQVVLETAEKWKQK